LGKEIPPDQVREGVLAPKDTLRMILAEEKADYPSLLAGLTPHAASVLAAGQQARSLKATIESMLATSAHV
jgi:hypothetical protein